MFFFKIYIKELLKKVAALFGGVLISKNIYLQILFQRNYAIAELLSKTSVSLSNGVTCLIFSKDRPIQLFALLETMCIHVKSQSTIKIIYFASNEYQKKAYSELESHFHKLFFDINFIEESNSFKKTLLDVVDSVSTKSIYFLVDDILFIKPVNFDVISKIDPLRFIVSLRLGRNIIKSYTTGKRKSPPKFIPAKFSLDLNQFDWFESGNEWADPWSLDGNIFSTKEVALLSKISDFSGPNSYEIALKTFNDFMLSRQGLCFDSSRIINLPVNKVQIEVNNKSGDLSAEFLFEKWQSGFKMDISYFLNYTPESPHEEHVISFVKRFET